jgi:hypothetical protein
LGIKPCVKTDALGEPLDTLIGLAVKYAAS